MTSPRNQSGAALIVALLMLTVLAILGVSAVNNSTSNLRITYNMQAYQDAEAAAQDAIEQVISDIGNFKNPTAQTINVNDYFDVQITVAPVCLGKKPSEGNSATFKLSTEDTDWVYTAVATDTVTGAVASVTQGVTIPMKAGSCL